MESVYEKMTNEELGASFRKAMHAYNTKECDKCPCNDTCCEASYTCEEAICAFFVAPAKKKVSRVSMLNTEKDVESAYHEFCKSKCTGCPNVLRYGCVGNPLCFVAYLSEKVNAPEVSEDEAL